MVLCRRRPLPPRPNQHQSGQTTWLNALKKPICRTRIIMRIFRTTSESSSVLRNKHCESVLSHSTIPKYIVGDACRFHLFGLRCGSHARTPIPKRDGAQSALLCLSYSTDDVCVQQRRSAAVQGYTAMEDSLHPSCRIAKKQWRREGYILCDSS